MLLWPSSPGEIFIIAYRPTLDPSASWTLLDTSYDADATGTETTFIHEGVVVYPPPQEGSGGDPLTLRSEFDDSTFDEPLMPPLPWDERFWSKPSEDEADGLDDSDSQPLGSMGFYRVVELTEDIAGDLLSSARARSSTPESGDLEAGDLTRIIGRETPHAGMAPGMLPRS